MKKFFLSFVLVLSLFFSYNINAKDMSKSINESKIIIKLENNYKYNNTLKSKIEKQLNLKIKSYEKITLNKQGAYYVLKLSGKIDNLNKKFNKIKDLKEIKKVQASYKYTYEPASKKKMRAAVTADNWHVSKMNVDAMKSEVADSTTKIKVGVIDTGIDYNHPNLKNIIDKNLSYNFVGNNKDASDDQGHGTHVAGLIGGENDYSSGKNVEIVALRVFDFSGAETEDIVKAINYAEKNKIKVINLSLGYEGYWGVDELLFNSLKNYSGLAVAAAGNSGLSMSDYPAGFDLDNIISVGAMDRDGNKVSFSNYSNTDVDIFAPGQNVFSTCSIGLADCNEYGFDNYDPNTRLAKMSGTSMSSPLVAGVAATLLSENNNLTTEQLKNAIIDSAQKSEGLQRQATTEGYIDAQKALSNARDNINYSTNKAQIQNDGSINLWGSNTNGELGNNTTSAIDETSPYNYKISGEKIVNYTLTKKNTFLITDKGNLYVAGKNDYGQLGQTNNNDSNNFVKFIKASNAHKITSINLRNNLGLYDENSLKINLEKTNKNINFYKIGNDAYKLNSDDLQKTKNLQYVLYKDSDISKIVYYKNNSRSIDVVEQFNIYKEYDEDFEEYYTYIDSKTITKYYNGYYIQTINYLYDCGNEYYMQVITKKSNKHTILDKKVISYDVYCYVDYLKETYKSKKYKEYQRNDTYKNGKKVRSTEYNFNNYGQLKGTSGGANKTITNYNSKGKITTKYYAIYDKNGKLSKGKLIYRAKYGKSIYSIEKFNYDKKLKLVKKNKIIKYNNGRTKYYNELKYKNSKKTSYLVRNYSKGIRSKETVYKYNKNGKLKTEGKSKAYKYIKTYKKGKLVKTERYTYNNTGKLTNYRYTYA